jgi:hypothetical protein
MRAIPDIQQVSAFCLSWIVERRPTCQFRMLRLRASLDLPGQGRFTAAASPVRAAKSMPAQKFLPCPLKITCESGKASVHICQSQCVWNNCCHHLELRYCDDNRGETSQCSLPLLDRLVRPRDPGPEKKNRESICITSRDLECLIHI